MKRTNKADKEEARWRRIEEKALAAQLAVECVECGEAGKILSQGVPPLTSAPPLWLVENEWLLEANPLCANCIAAGARIELCFEGGTQHKFCQVGDHMICPDCGGDCDDPGISEASTALVQMRMEGAMAAREAEIAKLVEWMDADVLSGPERDATAQRIKHLGADLRWRDYLHGPKDRVLH